MNTDELKSSLASPEDFDDLELLERIRKMRAEIQDLQVMLTRVRKGEIALKPFSTYITKTRADVNALLEGQDFDDNLRHLVDAWEQIEINPLIATPEATFDVQEQLHYLDVLDDQFKQIIFRAAALTVPDRVNQWLKKARPGYYIPFHVVFEDEIPDATDRTRVLNLLSYSPETLKGGLIDPANGVIYAVKNTTRAKTESVLALIGAVALATVVVAVAAFLPIPGWPWSGEDAAPLLIGWGAVIVGMVVHLGVGSLKRNQTGGLPVVISLGDLPLLINARIGEFSFRLLLGLVALFGLAFVSGMDKLTVVNAFLAGYSLDSLVELFGSSVEQQAQAQVKLLSKQLHL